MKQTQKFITGKDLKESFSLFAHTKVTKETIVSNHEVKKEHKVKKTTRVGSAIKDFLSKLSRGLMLPIAMLPIAGLFLGIGSAIATQAQNAHNQGLEIFGNILKTPGNAIFSNLPVLFCIAIAITFTEDIGTAALSAFVGWLIFCAFQNALILNVNDGYMFLWYKYVGNDGVTMFNAVFGDNVGIKSLNSSVFGGFIVGWITAFLYNKFKNIQLPKMLGFFSGVRFVPIITFVTMLGVSLIFSMIWPVFGLGLYKLGQVLGKAPYGINSLFFGYIERALVPFGLHHAFYMPLWQTSAGGSITLNDPMVINGLQVKEAATWLDFAVINGYSKEAIAIISGDQNCWMFINSYLAGHKVTLWDGKQDVKQMVITFETIRSCFDGVNVGQYMQGKYAFMMFGLPAAAVAMIVSAPKGDSRKIAFSTVFGAALTSFLTGITEPIEFTFLFLAPALYYGFHAIFCAISFWVMNLAHAHMGMTFSGGAIDYVLYGVIGDATGQQTKCWVPLIIGAAYIPVYFFSFWFFIKKFDIKTPGRGGTTRLFTKKDFLEAAKKSKDAIINNTPAKAAKNQDNEIVAIVNALGGADNVQSVNACITKLRVDVKDIKKVKDDELKSLGAHGVMHMSDKLVHAVFGTRSDVIKNKIKDYLKDIKK